MLKANYDQFLADVLCRERTAFGFAAHPAFGADLPAELVWLLIRALIREKELKLNQAARVVLDFTERNGKQIPGLLAGKPFVGKNPAEDAAETRERTYLH